MTIRPWKAAAVTAGLVGCSPAAETVADPDRTAQRTPAPTTAPAQSESAAQAARRVEVEALRRGAPGVTTPVYDPTLAQQPGQSFATQDDARRAVEARERRRRPDGSLR